MTYYVCEKLATVECDGYCASNSNQVMCNKWVEVQEPIKSNSLDSLAITKQQAFELSSAIAVIFIMCYCYKILERNFL